MVKSKPAKRMVPSWTAYVLSLAALLAGFVFAAFVPAAPYEYFSWAVVGLGASYFAKRVVDKKFKDIRSYESDDKTLDPNAGGLG